MPNSEKTPILQQDFNAPSQDLDLLHWVQILWDQRFWIAGVTAAVVILVALYTFLATPIYSATATVYVQTSSRQPMGSFNPTGASSWMEEQKFYNSQQQIMASRAVVQEVVDQLKLQDHPGFRGSKDPAAILRGMVKVDNIREIAEAGADTFVAGSAIFRAAKAGDPNRYNSVVKAMRDELAKARG